MLGEILAQTLVCKQMLVELYAKQEGLDYSEALAKVEKRIDQNRKWIDEKLDTDYGHIDIDDLTKKPVHK